MNDLSARARGAERAVSGRYGVESHASPFWPVLLAVGALLLWSGFQTVQLVRERTALADLRAAQQPQLDQAQKLRAALDQLAASTQRLADQGEANAKLLVDELRKRGVTINPNAPSGATASALPR